MSYPGPYDDSQQPDWGQKPPPPAYPEPYIPPAQAYPAPGYGQQPYVQQPYGQQPYGQPMYAAGGYATDPGAPFGRDPFTGEPLSDKSKVAAGLLQLFLGGFGVGRFYIGSNGIAAAQLATLIIGWVLAIILIGYVILLGLGVWVIVDAIMIFTGSVRDSRGLKLRD